MTELTREDILKLARLARLSLSEDEIAEYSTELTQILQYVDLLQAVDVTGLKPTNQITGLTNISREDVIVDYGYSPEDLRANLPDIEEGQIKVKRMLG